VFAASRPSYADQQRSEQSNKCVVPASTHLRGVWSRSTSDGCAAMLCNSGDHVVLPNDALRPINVCSRPIGSRRGKCRRDARWYAGPPRRMPSQVAITSQWLENWGVGNNVRSEDDQPEKEVLLRSHCVALALLPVVRRGISLPSGRNPIQIAKLLTSQIQVTGLRQQACHRSAESSANHLPGCSPLGPFSMTPSLCPSWTRC